MTNLSKDLSQKNLFIKRDDLTGLAFGGNKTRKLDFIMADALNKKSTTIITWGGIQSNWCRQLTAAANILNIKPVLILFKKSGSQNQLDGNYLLDYILESQVEVVDQLKDQKIFLLKDIKGILEAIIKKNRIGTKGLYIAPLGGSQVEGSMSTPLGAISYVNGFIELLEQSQQKNLSLDSIVLATGSASTQAGLIVGAKILQPKVRIIGISVSEDTKTMKEFITKIGNQTLDALRINQRIKESEIIVFDQYLGEGYGIINQKISRIIGTVAKADGILLDPVYTAKAMWGMIDLIKKGYFSKGENILFLHTGGTPALFPYKDKIVQHLSRCTTE